MPKGNQLDDVALIINRLLPFIKPFINLCIHARIIILSCVCDKWKDTNHKKNIRKIFFQKLQIEIVIIKNIDLYYTHMERNNINIRYKHRNEENVKKSRFDEI